ncbi:hypothetical protein ACJX0J_015220, partial [Zea mays]
LKAGRARRFFDPCNMVAQSLILKYLDIWEKLVYKTAIFIGSMYMAGAKNFGNQDLDPRTVIHEWIMDKIQKKRHGNMGYVVEYAGLSFQFILIFSIFMDPMDNIDMIFPL